MSHVKDNDDVFLSFEHASCRGIGRNARNAQSNGCERSSDSTSHGFSFLGRRVHRENPAIMPGFGEPPPLILPQQIAAELTERRFPLVALYESAFGTKQTFRGALAMSATEVCYRSVRSTGSSGTS